MRVPLLAASAAVLLVSGCTGLAKKISGDVDATDAKISVLNKNIGHATADPALESTPTVTYKEGIWLGHNVVKLSPPMLPSIFYQQATFDRTVSSLPEFAERITLRAGIPTKVTPDALGIASAAPSAAAPEGTAAAAPSSTAAASPAPTVPVHTGPIRIAYSNGNFKGLLDTAAARFGVSWKYVNGTIQFFHTDSRTFQINAIPGDASFSANVVSGSASTGGEGGGAGGGGGSSTSGVSANNSQNTGVKSVLSVYTSIENTVKAMLSPDGKVVAAPATGTITVVDTPDSLNRIAAYIEDQNEVLAKQVVINVTVLSVTTSANDQYGINWTMVYQSLRQKYGITNTFAAADNATEFSAGVVETSTSNFAGTNFIIKALSEQGKVQRQTSASVVTLNNQPVPVQVATQTSYLKSSQTTTTAQVGTTTTLIPGTITAGFNMSILPHVLANGTVMLQFSTDISTLHLPIKSFASNDTQIQTPELDTRNFLQRVAMKPNQTLILSGFEQTDDNLAKQGVGRPDNYAFGGGYTAKTAKQAIVVLITPTTMAGS